MNGFQVEPDDDTALRMPPMHCPVCGNANDAISQPLGTKLGIESAPVDGDYSVCFYCGELAVFSVTAFGVAMRSPTMAELKTFAANPNFTQYVRALHAFHAQRQGETP